MTTKYDAYRVDDCCWYAAENFEEAVKKAMDDTGNPREAFFDNEGPEDDTKELFVDDENTIKQTLREIMDVMEEPGLVMSTEG